jgi:hypothetical protein
MDTLSAEKLTTTIIKTSQDFAPLHHTICALSLLSMYYGEQARLEDALQRNVQAVERLKQAVISHHDLASDGVLFFHLISLIYEIFSPLPTETFWINHFEQLLRIAQVRRQLLHSHTFEFVVEISLAHDIHACLATDDNWHSGRQKFPTGVPAL